MRVWFNQAEKTCRPRSSRRCSCGHDIVRVVGARAEQLKRTDQRHAVRGDPEGHGAVAAVAPAGDIGQQAIDVLGAKRAHLGVGGDVGRIRLDHELLAIEHGQVGFRDVVAERVKEARRDHLGAGRQLGRVPRVEAQQVDPVVRVLEHERRPKPLSLQQQDAPGTGPSTGADRSRCRVAAPPRSCACGRDDSRTTRCRARRPAY